MKKIIGLKEFRNRMDVWIKHVAHGNSIVVFRKSKPIFKVIPVSEDVWGEIVDFTKVQKGGVRLESILKNLESRIKKLESNNRQ